MKTEEIIGEWFLPDSDFRLSGQLRVDHKKRKIELVLYGTRYIENKEIKIGGSDDHSEYYHNIILGNTDFRSITLANCKWAQTKVIGHGLFQIRYRVGLMFAGIHAKKKAHIRISKAALKYPYLSSWYDGPNSVSMLNQDESVPEPSMEVTDVTDEIKFSFVSEFHKWPIKFGISYQINFEKLLEIQYSLPKGFDTLLRDAVLFSKLLEFSIRKKIQFKVLGISVDPTDLLKVDDRMQSNGLLYVPITYFGSYSDNELIDKHEVHQNFMLISSWVLSKEAINNVVKKWFSNEGYFHIYDYYLDSHNWFEGTGAVLTSVMFNGRFLNLIQALESYHKKLDSTYKQNADGFRNQKARIADFIKSDNDLMAWFNNVLKGPPENFSLQERLQDLLSKIDPIIVSLFSTNKVFSSFPREAKDYRHKLSHGDLDGTDLGRPLVKLFYQAQLILSILILASLDFSESEILRIVRHNQNFIRDINEIIHNHKNP